MRLHFYKCHINFTNPHESHGLQTDTVKRVAVEQGCDEIIPKNHNLVSKQLHVYGEPWAPATPYVLSGPSFSSSPVRISCPPNCIQRHLAGTTEVSAGISPVVQASQSVWHSSVCPTNKNLTWQNATQVRWIFGQVDRTFPAVSPAAEFLKKPPRHWKNYEKRKNYSISSKKVENCFTLNGSLTVFTAV